MTIEAEQADELLTVLCRLTGNPTKEWALTNYQICNPKWKLRDFACCAGNGKNIFVNLRSFLFMKPNIHLINITNITTLN